MSEDPLDALARAAAQGSRESTNARIDKERRTQKTARVVRRSLRWSMLGIGVLSIALVCFSTGAMQVVGAFGLLIALALGVALFFMGGLVPAYVRRNLSERQRKLLDD